MRFRDLFSNQSATCMRKMVPVVGCRYGRDTWATPGRNDVIGHKKVKKMENGSKKMDKRLVDCDSSGR